MLLLYQEKLAHHLPGINTDRIRVTFQNIKQAFQWLKGAVFLWLF